MSALIHKIFFVGVVFVLILPATTFGQDDKQEETSSEFSDNGWFTIGLGGDFNGYKEFENWPALSFSANIGKNRFWQVGIFWNGPILGNEYVNAVHVGRGISEFNRWSRVSVAGGPAFVIGNEYHSDQGKYNKFYTPGIAVNAQAIFTPIMELGIGAELQGNLNIKNPMAGIRFIFVIEGVK